MNVDSLLYEHRLYISSEYEEIAGYFCNLVGSKTKETKERFLLSNWYEGYIFSLLLGIRIKSRIDSKEKKLDKAPKWSRNYIKQYKYAISLFISNKNILYELNLLDYSSIVNSDVDAEIILIKIKKICDEFSNGGLQYLKDEYEKDNPIFDDYDSLINIMKLVINKE